MKIEQVACITYTIRDHIRTPEDFRRSMAKVAGIGYRAVQISGMEPDLLGAEEIRTICADNGLTICATHEPSDQILNSPERVAERLETLGVRYTAYPFPGGIDFNDPESRSSLIRKLDKAGAVLRESGSVLTYHNHATEFVKWEGKPALAHIYDETDPANLQAELDTYWIQLGGGNPVEWCERLKGRLPLLHLKDVGVREGNEPTMFEIGEGNLDFKTIIAAAESSGCEWFIVEQDTCPGDPFESLRKSFDFIRRELVE